MSLDWESIRVGLTIGFGLILFVMLYKRLAAHFGPQPPPENQAWLMDMRVCYHPQRLEVEVHVPLSAEVKTDLIDGSGRIVLSWGQELLSSGNHTLKRPLEGIDTGSYVFRIATGEQSTKRGFQIKYIILTYLEHCNIDKSTPI